LVEYTLFSANELTSEQYDEGLKHFLQNELKLPQYRITEVEQGIIPMTNYGFTKREGRVVYIGTAGGQTKASTGYTFSNMQKHAASIVKGLVLNNLQLLILPASARFNLYDSILLRVLAEEKIPGADVFFSIFRHNPAHRVFRFLDNASSFGEELAIMVHSPRWIFSKAALRQIF
jgi:lycopene beta-cyclase